MRYLAYLRNAFLQSIAYRTALYLSLMNVILLLVIQYYLWTAVFDVSVAPGGFTLSEMLTYVLLARALGAFFNITVDTEMGNRIRRGTIAADLARPVDLQAMWFKPRRQPGQPVSRDYSCVYRTLGAGADPSSGGPGYYSMFPAVGIAGLHSALRPLVLLRTVVLLDQDRMGALRYQGCSASDIFRLFYSAGAVPELAANHR